MCGFVSTFSRKTPVAGEQMARALAALHHRGPDARGRWRSDDGRVALGHARLSIIDLSTGGQPLANEDEAIHAVVNGEFYGFQGIRAELEGRGHRFRTNSDSEILVHLYEEYGAQCLHRLRGEFAFALWDGRRRSMLVARDRFGIKPLFYATHRDTTWFASEAKALFAAGVPARWDHESVSQFHNLMSTRQERTIFLDVRQLPPGHYALVSDDGVEVYRYWDFDYLPEAEKPRDARDYAEEFGEAFREAIRLRLHADVPVAVYLSGGLDSTAVVAEAQRLATRPLRAFSIGFEDPAYDELSLAAGTAAHVGADFEAVRVTSADLAAHFSAAVWHAESFLINANSVAKYLLSRAVRDAGYKVVLTGEGADEILAGYAHFRIDMATAGGAGLSPEARTQKLRELAATNAASAGTLLPTDMEDVPDVSRVLGFVPAFMSSFAKIAARSREVLRPSYLQGFSPHDGHRGFLDRIDVTGQLRGRHAVEQALYLWSKCGLPNYVLSLLGDRMEMAHSIEGRLPFLDHHLVELVAKYPVAQKIHENVEKFVLREAVKARIPETVYRRQKHPFMAPPLAAALHGGPFSELLQDTLRSAAFDRQPFYEPKTILGLLDEIPNMSQAGRNSLDPLFLSALSACALQEQFRL